MFFNEKKMKLDFDGQLDHIFYTRNQNFDINSSFNLGNENEKNFSCQNFCIKSGLYIGHMFSDVKFHFLKKKS